MDLRDAEIERLRGERDLYRRLLELGAQIEPERFLAGALALVVEVSGARQGYLELHATGADDRPCWSMAHGFSADELGDVRSLISRGIVGEAISSGTVVDTACAMSDPRFEQRASVTRGRIRAVLCAPIGSHPPLGVLYLQGRDEPGTFSTEERERAEVFARHVAPLAEGLVLRRQAGQEGDPTRAYRRSLQAESVIGRSPAMASLLREVSLVSPLGVTVLLTGDSGTGKSQIARVIHESSPRAGSPMVELNCPSLPETLVESELFGALPGSHSTATKPLAGKVAAAEGGTLLLDEVGELPLGVQAKLLQLLQAKQYYPLGASRPSTADVRLIAATNADLQAAVRDGRFREDLFYRLAVLPVRVPSLAERRTDIPELARAFCEKACERNGLPRLELSSSTLRALEAAEWPGNIRQLEHALQAGAIRAAGAGATRVERHHVFPGAAADAPEAAGRTLQEETRRFQAELVRERLAETDWNISETARRLEVARSHLYKLISAFGLERTRD